MSRIDYMAKYRNVRIREVHIYRSQDITKVRVLYGEVHMLTNKSLHQEVGLWTSQEVHNINHD